MPRWGPGWWCAPASSCRRPREQVEAFRHRTLDDAGPFTFVAADALTMKVREHGRVINAVVLVATDVNGDGHREALGVRVATAETKTARNEIYADLGARGLTGVRLVTSDAHASLIEAIAANLPGTSWQRCRTHHAANLMGIAPKSLWPAVGAKLHSVYDQPDATAVHAQFHRLLDYAAGKLSAIGEPRPRPAEARRLTPVTDPGTEVDADNLLELSA